ncbi:MBL fold metallo-hydrolase [Rhodoferax sp. 4810]|uniref:MBL fold metallo-hydrolase n=1 Tax=Thiospirillum jenense TaxID=1653858 RepID=A0A839H266_9GAMM|nr:MBL fold metallo-hydrolase [Thiospirillum jenense]MBB1073206.1 MBL fold metallo-hydrolase [Rhodoferax jenense]MBB1124633.1 MBL fold metallo-hydrolase [Thiospirillum jenense]
MPLSSAQLTILFDNIPGVANTRPLWGFAAQLRTSNGQILLFDTGSNGRVLLKNMTALNCDPQAFQWLFLSHQHWDHIGGVDSIIELNPQLTCVVHDGFSKHLTADLAELTAGCLTIDNLPVQFAPHLWSTGMFHSEPPEHALIIETQSGLHLITGCAHPGIVQLINHVQTVFKQPVQTVIGGFHLGAADETTIANTVTALLSSGIQRILPTHCTGIAAMTALKTAFGTRCLTGGAGCQIQL